MGQGKYYDGAYGYNFLVQTIGMGIVIRQSSWSTLLSYSGIVLGYINVLYLFPAYLTAGEIGITRVVQDFAMLLVSFAQLGTRASIIRYFPSMQNNRSKADSFFSLMLFLSLIGYLIFLLLAYGLKNPLLGLFIEKSPEVVTYFWLVLVLVLIMVIHNVISDFTRSFLEILVPNFLKEVLLRLWTTLSIAAYIIGWVDFDGFVYCIVGAYLLNLVILSAYLFAKTSTRFKPNFFNELKFSEIKPIITYGLYALIGASGAIIVSKVDVVMVTSMLGTFETGIYTLAFYMAVIIEVPRRVVTQISAPLISRHLESVDLRGIRDIYTKSSINLFIIGFLFLIGILTNLDNIYHYVPNNEIYEAGKLVVIFVGLGKLIDMSFGLNGEIIILSKYYKINILLTGFLALITIATNYYLIPIYGITGAAVGTTFSIVIFNLLKFIFIWVKFKLQPFTLNHLKLLFIGGLIFSAAYLTPSLDNHLVDLILRSFLIFVVYVGLVYVLKISEEINTTLHEMYKKVSTLFR